MDSEKAIKLDTEILTNPQDQEEEVLTKQGRDYFKIKYAVIFGYSGEGYSGLQFQPGDIKTVERELEDAFVQAKLIHPSCQGDAYKSGWARASRTDKGVHAVVNGINVKLDIRDELLRDNLSEEEKAMGKGYLKLQVDRKKFTSMVNNFLPDDIKVFDLMVVSKSFIIKDKVHSRRYEYIIPFKYFYKYQDEETSSKQFF